ncbi:MAG: RNA polymerase factor sigma-54 [bacterium]
MAELSLQHDLRQTLELLLAPRMLQMLKVLQLPYSGLIDHIAKEAEENPVLEVERKDEYVEFIRYLTSDRSAKKQADFQEMPGLENIGNVEKSLDEHLLEQLELEDIEDDYRAIATQIIGNIDDFGYVIAYPKLRERLMKEFDVSRPTVDKVLKIVQTFEPEGVGARDLKECLQIQIREYSFESQALKDILETAVEKHLVALSEKDFAKVAKEMGVEESGVIEIANFIKNNLNPNPGSSFGGETKHVIPSFAVEQRDTGFEFVNLETRYGPKVNLSPHYLAMLDDKKTDEKTREFIKEKLKSAKHLIEDFYKRNETLEKIVRKIIDSQTDFLKRGIIWLRPLSQKSLADEFGLHPSTISRSVAEKYIQTPQGLFPLRFLCPRGPRGLTVLRMKALITEIVGQENKQAPLSDSQITKLLHEQGGKIDRRTLAYYRKELNIPSADERKK